ADELFQQMVTLYQRAAVRPVNAGAMADLEKRAAAAKADEDWKRAVKTLTKTSDEYFAALGGAAPEARALYYRGVGSGSRRRWTCRPRTRPHTSTPRPTRSAATSPPPTRSRPSSPTRSSTSAKR